MTTIMEAAAAIRLVIFDVDGVLTDAKLFFDDSGREYKAFHSRDGHGIKLLRGSGVEVAVISGRSSEAVSRRMAGLGVQHVYQGQEDKIAAFEALCAKLSLNPETVAYVGDDLPDLPVMRRVGLAVAVHDAHFAVKQHAHWITENAGGCGAAREVCDLIMKARNSLEAAIHRYL